MQVLIGTLVVLVACTVITFLIMDSQDRKYRGPPVTVAGLMAQAKAEARRTDPVCEECGLQPTIDTPPCIGPLADDDGKEYPKCWLSRDRVNPA